MDQGLFVYVPVPPGGFVGTLVVLIVWRVGVR